MAALLGLCAAAPRASAESLDHVVLQLKWRHQFQFAGYYAAIDQGYYRDAGLNVELREAVPGRDPAENVLSGAADFGVGTSELLLLRDKGRPVVVLAAIFQHSPLILLVDGRTGVTDLQALHDRPMMIEPQSAELYAYFKYEGLDPSALRLVPHSFRIRDLVDGRVAAMSGYITDEPFQLKEAGLNTLTFMPRSGGIDFYGDNLFTTEEQIRTHPARVRAFLAASLKGWDYALSHQREMVDLILDSYNRGKSRAQLTYEAEMTARLMHPGLIETGHMNPGRWRHMADVYAEFGMVTRDMPLDGFLYDPNPHSDTRWMRVTTASLAGAAFLGLGWALPLVRLKRRLKAETTARRAAEEQLRIARHAADEANQSKARYLAVMTHEVRSRLDEIGGCAAEIRAAALGERQREAADRISRSAEEVMLLSNEVLDYSKIDAGTLVLEKVPVFLSDFVRTTAEFFRAPAMAKGLELTHTVQPGAPVVVLTDPTRMRQIVANLLSNAVKFTERGSVELSLQAETLPAPKESGEDVLLTFLVRDSGIGIPDEEIARILGARTFPEPAVAGRLGGSGLGLAVTQRLAELLGGEVTVQSVPGHGTLFKATVLVTAA